MRCRSGILEDDWCVGCKSWLHGFSLLDVFLNLWDGIFPVFQRPGIRSLAYRLYRVQSKVVGFTASCWKFVETQINTINAFWAFCFPDQETSTGRRTSCAFLPVNDHLLQIQNIVEKSWCFSLSWWEIIGPYGNHHPSLRLGNVGKFQPGLGLIQFHSPLHQSPLHIDQRTLIPTVSCRFTWSWVIFN